MKKDIKNRKDIEMIIAHFYEKVKADAVIGYYFSEVVPVNWEMHLPLMCDFWENILFFTANYDGNPMEVHKKLNQKTDMEYKHFSRWNELFKETIDEYYQGEKAQEMKNRASNIAQAMIAKTIENKNAEH